MPIKVSDLDAFGKYIQGVLDRADHHAGPVDAVVLTIAGATLWRKDPGVPLQVKKLKGEARNAAWVVISGQRYALSYNHKDGTIEIRDGSTQGQVLASFTNSTSPTEIKKFFASL